MMEELGTISVIVPVYKAEAYLSRCVDSILAQTYRDLEIVLVDDGSPDSSGAICDQYAEKDRRVRAIHQPNKGVSAARNAGLKNATGTWAAFVDSDDQIEPGYIQALASCAIKTPCDLVTGRLSDSRGNVRDLPPFARTVLSQEEILERFWTLLDGGLLNSVCGKLFRRAKIESAFFEEMRCGEDLRFTLDYLKNTAHMVLTDAEGYRCADDSADAPGTTKYRKRNLWEFSLYVGGVRELLEHIPPEQRNQDRYEAFVFRGMCGDVKWISRSRPFGEAAAEIARYLELADVCQALKHRAWRRMGWAFRVVGWLLRLHWTGIVVLCCRL